MPYEIFWDISNKYKVMLKTCVPSYLVGDSTFHYFHTLCICLFVCFVALRPKSTAMVMAGRSVHLASLFPGQA